MKYISGELPTIDISDDTNKQVVVDKEKNRYLAHVSSTTYSHDNSIYVVYMRGHGRGQALMKRSSDFGDTWSERLELPESWLTLLQVPTVFEIECPNERKKLMMITGHIPIRSSFYDADKELWSELKPIGKFGGNVSMSSFVKLSNGKYIGFFHDDGRYINNKRNNARFQLYKSNCDNDIQVVLARSTKGSDNKWSRNENDLTTKETSERKWSKRTLIYESYFGLKEPDDVSKIYRIIYDPSRDTWEKPEIVISHEEAYLAEAGACFSPNKEQLLLVMRDNTRKFNSFISTSSNNGNTWSNPIEGHESITGDRHVIKYTMDGRIICLFRDTHPRSKTNGDWIAWVGTYEDIVNKRKGQYKIRLKKNHNGIDCGYSGLEILENGEIVAVSYGHWKKNENPYILSVKFNLEEIDEFITSKLRGF